MKLLILKEQIAPFRNQGDLAKEYVSLLRRSPDSIFYTISQNDIEAYVWAEQFIILNEEASKKARASFAQSGTSQSLSRLNGHVFVVTIDDHPIYSGEFAEIGSARAIDTPVAYSRLESGRVVFVLRPLHVLDGDYSGASANWNGIRDERIKHAAVATGKMR